MIAKNEKTKPSKKSLILEAACLSLYRRGAHHTNAQAIANDLKISQAAVFYHFSKQQELFDSLFLYALERGREVRNFDDDGHLYGPLVKYLASQLEWSKKFPHHIAVLFYYTTEAYKSPRMGDQLRAALNHGEQTIFSAIAEDVIENRMSKPKDPRLTASLIHQNLIGIIFHQFLNAPVYEKKKPSEIALQLVQSHFATENYTKL